MAEGKYPCPKCGTELKILKATPRFGRRTIGKQYFKGRCPKCRKIFLVKL